MIHPPAFQIKVPGSTSNLGPGFDSIGMAVNRYLVLDARQADRWQFNYVDQPDFHPPVAENLIYRTAKKLAEHFQASLPPYEITVHSDIPLARGLGSSGAAIISGIELADFLLDLKLSIEEKSWLACRTEGHPDNVTASLYGGLVVSTQSAAAVHSVKLPVPDFDFVTLIPDFELKTSDARHVLPDVLPFHQAIEGSSVANVLICALLSHNGKLAGQMMESDHFHQPYRAKLIPDLEGISSLAKSAGAFGTFLSGAGPTVMCLAPQGKSSAIKEKLQTAFPNDICVTLHPVSEGAVSRVTEAVPRTEDQ
jgi:homoserine kinase